MSEFLAAAEKFWDHVFADMPDNEQKAWVKNRSADETIGMLSMVGPFEEELAAAKCVLDVGPGEANLLRSLSTSVSKYAIEVSVVNRARLAEWGIEPVHPGSRHPDIDLAWSVSVFQHCDYPTQKMLIEQVATWLRAGGIFYLEHVMAPSSYGDQRSGGPAAFYPCGVGTVELIALNAGLTTTNVVRRVIRKDMPVIGYFMRFEKKA